jgi:hypothetical protein
MRRALTLLLAVIAALTLLTGCGLMKTKTLHCDYCGREVKVSADSDMTDDWIIYCSDCEKELGLDDLILARD